MTSVGNKAAYVRSEARKGSGGHHCHWPDCENPVPPSMWGCKFHWFKLPARLRSRIWATYRPGQEIGKTPSAAYLAVAKEVQDWIVAQGIEARSDETPQAVQPEGREPGPKDAPKTSVQQAGRG